VYESQKLAFLGNAKKTDARNHPHLTYAAGRNHLLDVVGLRRVSGGKGGFLHMVTEMQAEERVFGTGDYLCWFDLGAG